MPRIDRDPETRGTRGRGIPLTVALAAAWVVFFPTVANAAPNRSAPPDVVPLVDCIRIDGDGTWTAIFGYDNRTGADVGIPVGPANRVTPKSFDGKQPTHFEPGIHHGAVVVTVPKGGGPMWHLGSVNLAARTSDTVCDASTQLPADGNGTGLVVALGAAGVVGAVLVRRAGYRAPSFPRRLTRR